MTDSPFTHARAISPVRAERVPVVRALSRHAPHRRGVAAGAVV